MPIEPYDIEIIINDRRFKDPVTAYSALAKNLEINKRQAMVVFKKQLHKFLNNIADEMEKQHSGSWPGGTSTTTLSRRSGRLVKSIRRSVYVKGNSLDNVEGGIGGDETARLHEFSGYIWARSSKMLTIPLDAALNSKGLPKKMSARQWNNTFIRRSRSGNLIIFQRYSRRSIRPLYLLKRRVYIPDRLGMGKAINKGITQLQENIIKELELTFKEI